MTRKGAKDQSKRLLSSKVKVEKWTDGRTDEQTDRADYITFPNNSVGKYTPCLRKGSSTFYQLFEQALSDYFLQNHYLQNKQLKASLFSQVTQP